MNFLRKACLFERDEPYTFCVSRTALEAAKKINVIRAEKLGAGSWEFLGVADRHWMTG